MSEGWYPDPWRRAAYRWWNGREWTALTAPAARTKAQDVRHTALTLAVGLFSFWSAIWVIGLPLMMLGEADNGKFNNDFETIWLPNFALGVVGVIVSIAMLMLEKRRPELGNRVLLPPALIAVGAAFMFVVHP